MRVLHIIGTLDPKSGGPASSTITLIEHGAPDCVSEVLTLDNPASSYLLNAPFPVHALGPTRTRYGYNLRLLHWLKANRDRFDGVVVHGLWQYCGYAARRALLGHKPYLVFVHGMLDPYFKRTFPFKHVKKWIYWMLVEHAVLRDAHRVLFTSAVEQEQARQSFDFSQWSGEVVPYGASLPDGDPDLRKEAFISRFPQARGQKFILFLGRIHKKKGCDLLVEAFIHVASLDPALHLVFAGPDESDWRKDLDSTLSESGLSSRVHWTGMLHADEKWGAFLASEAFILPSHQENFGIAVAEAMACGKAVLLSDKVNIAREIEEGGAGLIEADTATGTRRLLERWIAMPPEERSIMGSNARDLFQRRFNMQVNASAVNDLFRGAVCADSSSSLIAAASAD